MTQRDYIEKVREIVGNSQKTAYIRTYGCQMNEGDSEKIAGILLDMGYGLAASEKDADLIIYNTCCVRENAENKIFGNLGRLKYYKERRPEIKIALCGCMIQQENVVDIIKSKHRHVDLLFGTFNLHKFPELLFTSMMTDGQVIDIWKEQSDISEEMPAVRKHRWKATINVMYGCDNFCAYCIVPYVRGRERSRAPEEILNEVKLFSKDGVKEVLLLGQNVNSYGKFLEKPFSFAELLRLIDSAAGFERIRFMTSHPKDFSDELIETVAELKKVCRHIHLPLQSGSTKILSKMNRKYTKEHYLTLIEKIRNNIPDVSITTDIIVGFPGETEEDFLDTLDVVEAARFSGAFTFIYSKRNGTPAAKMQQLDKDIVSERFRRLLEVQNRIVFEENQRYIGKKVEVLVDEMSKRDEDRASIVTGRTDGNALVHFEGGAELLGEFVNVKIVKNRAFFLEGEKLEDINDNI